MFWRSLGSATKNYVCVATYRPSKNGCRLFFVLLRCLFWLCQLRTIIAYALCRVNISAIFLRCVLHITVDCYNCYLRYRFIFLQRISLIVFATTLLNNVSDFHHPRDYVRPSIAALGCRRSASPNAAADTAITPPNFMIPYKIFDYAGHILYH